MPFSLCNQPKKADVCSKPNAIVFIFDPSVDEKRTQNKSKDSLTNSPGYKSGEKISKYIDLHTHSKTMVKTPRVIWLGRYYKHHLVPYSIEPWCNSASFN